MNVFKQITVLRSKLTLTSIHLMDTNSEYLFSNLMVVIKKIHSVG